MKKALSVILSVLVIFSMLGMAAAAADENLVTIKFVIREEGKEDIVLRELKAAPGVNFVDRIVAGGDMEIGVPHKASTETTEYIFKHWVNAETGEITYTGNVPAAKEGQTEITYVAVFAEEEIKENQTLWAFIQSLFERINMIFEYFAKVFEGVFDF